MPPRNLFRPMAARHPDVAAGPAAGGFLPVPVGTEPADLRVALCHARRSHGIGENCCFLFFLSRPQAPCPATRKSSRSAALGLCQPPGGATI